MEIYRNPAFRTETAALIAAVLAELARQHRTPVLSVEPEYMRWRRDSQESLRPARRELWQHPMSVGAWNFLGQFPEMDALRAVVKSDPTLRMRVDASVGTAFSRSYRALDLFLIEHLLTPMVLSLRAYRFDPAVFDQHYHRLEAGLFAEQIRLVEFMPLNGFVASGSQVQLPGSLLLRPMTDREISSAIRVIAVPVELYGNTTALHVSWLNQWALFVERRYPFVCEQPGYERPVTAPVFPSLDEPASRLVMALRIVCGGSCAATRSIRVQHDDDFPADLGEQSSMSATEPVDLNRPTMLSSDRVEEVIRVFGALGHDRVRGDRALQTALRRLVFAGSRRYPADRLVDLMICAEALFIKRAGGPRTQNKSALIAPAAAALLAADPVLAASGSDIEQLFRAAYRLRNAEMHGDDLSPRAVSGPQRAGGPQLGDAVESLERAVRRAVHLITVEVAAARAA